MRLVSFLFLLIFIYFQQNVNSQVTLAPSFAPTGGPVTAIPEVYMAGNDINCVDSMVVALGITSLTKGGDYCVSYPTLFKCNATTGYLQSFTLNGIGLTRGFMDATGSNTDFSSLNCFVNSPLPKGTFTNMMVQTGLWSSKISLSEIILDGCYLENIGSLTYYRGSVTVYPSTSNAFTEINLYQFRDLKKFVFINYYNLSPTHYNYRLANVFDNSPQSTIPELFKVQVTSFAMSSSSLFDNLKIKRLELIADNYATSDGGSYVSTMKYIEELSLKSTTTSFIPAGLFSSYQNSFKKIEMDIPLTSSDSQIINFNNLPTVETFIISNVNSLLTSTNQYKFASLGNIKNLVLNSVQNAYNEFNSLLYNIESLSTTNGQLSLDLITLFNVAPNLNNLYIDSTTGITGTITNDLCQLNSIVVKGANIGGVLPSCIYCYIDSSNQDFQGNSFDNYKTPYQIPPCTSIKPKFTRDSNKLYLTGSDLGFSTDYFTTDPKIDFVVDVPSFSFSTTQSVSGLVSVHFKIPNQNFTLDSSLNLPRIDSVLVSALEYNGVLTINGFYFSYNVDDVTVSVGNENCNIISTNFNQIKCQVNNYNPNLFNVAATVQIDTRVFGFPVSLTPNLENLYKSCTQDCSKLTDSQCSRFTGTCVPIISISSASSFINSPTDVTLTLNGYFGSSQGDLAVFVGGTSCQIQSFSINKITCSTPYNSQTNLQLYAIQNGYPGYLSTPFVFTAIKNCPSNCVDSSHGTCNYNSGICTCKSPYGGDSCAFKNPKVSSVLASNELGGEFILQGDFDTIGSDFKVVIGSNEAVLSVKNQTTVIGIAQAGVGSVNLVIVNNGITVLLPKAYTYTFDCASIGGCNNGKCIHMNECSCNIDYYGPVCTIKQHYVSSLIPTTVNGGKVIAFGEFGSNHTGLQILVGTELCENPTANSTTIECSIGAGTGVKSFTVKQNDLTWTRNNYFNYIDPIKSCPSNCTSKENGICDTSSGECKCVENKWSGYDCSIAIINNGQGNNEEAPKSTSTIDIETGVTQIQNQNTKFNISIIKILEISITNQSTVSEFELKQVWDSYETKVTSDGNNLYIFNQSLSTESSNIVYKIEEVKKSKSYDFAEVKYTVPDDSIKITIEINNYPFSSVLNVLQLQMLSSVEKNEIQDSSCNQKDSDAEIQDGSDTASFVKISMNSKILYGRFIMKIFSDNRATFISSEVVSKNSDSITLGLNLPHCDSSCVIDPDFSVLLSSDFKSSCGGSSNKSGIIAVAVVVPVVVISALIIAGAIYYKKNRINIRVKTMKLRSFK